MGIDEMSAIVGGLEQHRREMERQAALLFERTDGHADQLKELTVTLRHLDGRFDALQDSLRDLAERLPGGTAKRTLFVGAGSAGVAGVVVAVLQPLADILKHWAK